MPQSISPRLKVVTMMIPTAHAQKHFRPEAKSKVVPNFFSPWPLIQASVIDRRVIERAINILNNQWR